MEHPKQCHSSVSWALVKPPIAYLMDEPELRVMVSSMVFDKDEPVAGKAAGLSKSLRKSHHYEISSARISLDIPISLSSLQGSSQAESNYGID